MTEQELLSDNTNVLFRFPTFSRYKKLFNKMDFSVSNWEDSLFLFIDKYYDGK